MYTQAEDFRLKLDFFTWFQPTTLTFTRANVDKLNELNEPFINVYTCLHDGSQLIFFFRRHYDGVIKAKRAFG